MTKRSGTEDMPLRKRSKVSRSSALSRSKTQFKSKAQSWPFQNARSYAMLWDPFPATAKARLRYSTVVALNSTAGTPAHYLFRATSIFDPDYTGIGHQPYGHDTYQGIYNHYQVDRCVITMQPTNHVDSIYGIDVNDDITVEPDYDTIREKKGSTFSVITGGPQNQRILSKTYNKNFFTNKSDLKASFGSNPAENIFFDCWSEASGPTGDPNVVNYVITLTYDVSMWELKDLGQS